MRKLIFLVFPFFCFCLSEEQWARRVQSHLLIEDPKSALWEAQELADAFPSSRLALSTLIFAMSANAEDEGALEQWNQLVKLFPEVKTDRNLLEEMAWGVLKKGLRSTQYGVRLASLIGSFLTQDAKALPVLIKSLRDSNAVIRSVAVQMSGKYRDAPLKEEISRMLKEEKIWMVRLEVLKACGAMRMKDTAPILKSIIQSEKTTCEERLCAIESLCSIYDDIQMDEWRLFAHSNRAGMRHLACIIATHFELTEAKNDILALLHDSHPDVRIAALDAFGLFYRNICQVDEIQKHIQPVLSDSSPEVAITAAWVALISGLDVDEIFIRWLEDPFSENRRLAAAALAACGEKGVNLTAKILNNSKDPFVKANLAIGMLGIRQEIAKSSDVLFDFLTKEKRMWMWDSKPNPIFKVLAPSSIRHVDHIPNYPEAVDNMTRLSLFSTLCLVDDPRAIVALKSFLKNRTWGITGVAAAMLLQEGDETSIDVVEQLLDDPDGDVRLQACFVLAGFGKDESVLQILESAYPKAEHNKKLHILEALGHIGTADAFPFLLNCFKEPFPILRIAAAAALIQSIHR